MDESVIRSMAKWPDTPAVFGWLKLDMRGRWLLKGRAVNLPQSLAFINQNYGGDDQGRMFFQNGPQRVFVTLSYTPWVYKFDASRRLHTHTGLLTSCISSAWLDEDGILILVSEHGPGVVRDQDLAQLSEHFTDEKGQSLGLEDIEKALTSHLEDASLYLCLHKAIIKVQPIMRSEAPEKFGYQTRPTPNAE